MDYNKVFNKVQEVMRSVFKLDDLVIDDSLSAKEVVQWNSLSHVILIADLEKEYNIKFELTDMLDIKTVQDLCTKILALLGES